MKFWRSRTTLALVLTIAALVVPCGAWYIVGSREVQRSVEQIESVPRRHASDTAVRLMERLQGRLQTLLQSESNRPFYQYQSLYHDPRGASEGASVVPSPLAQGPTDPLIRAYFQIDPSGRVTMPTLPEGALGGEDQRRAAAQRAVQKELQAATGTSACVSYLQRAPPEVVRLKSVPPTLSAQQLATPQQRLELMEPDAWAQNAQANKIYSDIKLRNSVPRETIPQKGNEQKIEIGVGAFQWCSVQTSNGPSLVALRNVSTPEGILVQGFIISNEGVAETLKDAAMPAHFTPNATAGSYVAAARLESTGWYIVVSAAKEFGDAHALARHNWLNFLQFFWAGAGAASVAGLCVVALVWHTERLARQRSQFAASAAHELRTPLAGLRMYSEMLADGLGDPARSRDYADRVADEAARLGRVVSNVLGFTRLERGALGVRPVPGDLAGFVRDYLERQQPALEATGASVTLSVQNQFPDVRFDRDAVAEIIQNLLDNAEKYGRTADGCEIDVGLSATDRSVTLSVRDRGPGIPADMQRRLFHPFARGKQNDAPAGLGLGLVLVKALAKAHGGGIEYSDAPDGGALFSVILPR